MLIGTLVALVALVALLAVPLTLSFRVDTSRAIDYRLSLQWAFGLVNVEFGDKIGRPAARDDKTGKAEPRGRPPARGKKPNALAALRFGPFRRRLLRLVRDLWRAVHKKDVVLNLRVGLGDPADTGQLWAVLGPVAGALAMFEGASIRLLPDFAAAVVELQGSGRLRIVPLEIVSLAAGALLSPPMWQGMLRMRRASP